MNRQPAKLLIANAHGEIGNEANIIILARDAKGVRCFTNMGNDETVQLIHEFGITVAQAPRKERHDA